MLTLTERKIAAAVDAWAAIHRRELVEDLSALISIRSVSTADESGFPMGLGCWQAADQLLQLGQKYGFSTQNHDCFCVSILSNGTDGKKELGILGHIDVVPEGDGWRYPPFQATEKDGYLIGRGSSDNKGPVVMSLFVLRCMRELGLKTRSNLRLIAGCDEEVGMRDVSAYLRRYEAPAFTLNCDGAWAACIGEKGILTAELVQQIENGNLMELDGGTALNAVPDHAWAILDDVEEAVLDRACKRYPTLKAEKQENGYLLHIRGKAAHVSTPEKGDNAICRLLEVLSAEPLLQADAATKVERLRKCFIDHYGTGLRIFHEDRLSGKTTCVPSLLSLRNGKMSLQFDARTAVTQKEEMLLSSLRKRCARLDIQLENLQFHPPRYDAPDQPEAALLIDTCQQLLDASYTPYVSGGGTHSRVFPRSLPFGPGIRDPRRKWPFGGPHCADEAVCIEDLLRAMKVYVIALLRLDGFINQNEA